MDQEVKVVVLSYNQKQAYGRNYLRTSKQRNRLQQVAHKVKAESFFFAPYCGRTPQT